MYFPFQNNEAHLIERGEHLMSDQFCLNAKACRKSIFFHTKDLVLIYVHRYAVQ